MPSAIVFDLDETLVDRTGSLDVYARSLWSAFEKRSSLGQERFLALFFELDGNGRTPRPTFFASLALAAFDGVSAEEISTHMRTNAWLKPILFPDVIEVIEAFRSHSFAVGVVTNGSAASQRSKIENSGLDRHLDAYVLSEEFGAKKPDPRIYAEIAHRLGIDAARSWFVGDDPVSDVCGPAEYGFETAWIERHLAWPHDRERVYRLRISHIRELFDAVAAGI